MKKLLIALFFVFGLFLVLPMSARAENYNLWVGGVRVTSENMHDIKGTGEEIAGTVTFDPDTKTLTLENAHINGVYTDSAMDYVGNIYGLYFYSLDLTINLVGDNYITVPDNPNPSKSSNGIKQKPLDTGDFTIQGDGELTVSVGEASYVTCISGGRGSMTIGDEAKLTLIAATATNNSYGLFYDFARNGVSHALTIKESAQLTIEVNSGVKGALALASNDPILITDDAKVVVTVLGKSTANYCSNCGLHCGDLLTISGNAEVTVASGNTEGLFGENKGVYGSWVEVLDNAKLNTASGNNDGTGSTSYGMSVYNTVIVSDAAQVTAIGGPAADGESYGIACRTGDSCKIIFTDNTILVRAQGGTQAFSKIPVDGSDTPLTISGWDGTELVTYPCGSIALDQNGTYTFPSRKAGYGALTPLSVTVTNTGHKATGNLTVALSGADADSYTLSATALDSIGVSGTGSFTVVPKTGLAVGTHTATVTVSGENGLSASFDVSFTVSKKAKSGSGHNNSSNNNSNNNGNDNGIDIGNNSTDNSSEAVGAPRSPADTEVNNPFTDVRESDWFYHTVLQNYGRGLLGGTSATTFSPNAPMTRGMFATVLARIDGADLSGFTGTSFTDVDLSKYYGPSVAWASENGIIAGYGNGLFGPEDRISREQMAAMLANYIRVRNITIVAAKPEAGSFADDSQISPWAKDSVYLMQVFGLIGGRPGNIYEPKVVATRAEVAQVLLNYVNAVK